MARKQRKGRPRKRRGAGGRAVPPPQSAPVARFGPLRSAADGLLHWHEPEGARWRLFWPVLALAFLVRAVVALSGDFIVHPDESMQLLEPAHRLAFGNGVVYWEFFYGARSWLLPGLIAGLLKGFEAAGLGQPFWYVDGVKLAFCGLSLAIPAGMYCFARRHFGEVAGRAALLAGAFWYELVGLAHKPLTGMVAAAVFVTLLALCARIQATTAASGERSLRLWSVWLLALLAVLAIAIRPYYAPLVVLLLGLVLLRLERVGKVYANFAVAAAAFLLAVGVFDAVTWDAGLFHSYLTVVRFNFELYETGAASGSPTHQYLWWLLLASAGGSALCVGAALRRPRRYGLLLLLIALVLVLHSALVHKEYRYVFVVIPLWLLLGAGVLAELAAGAKRRMVPFAIGGAVFAVVSVAGILNALPGQDGVFQVPDQPQQTVVRFLRGQDPHFAAYRHLAEAPGVAAVWQPGRHHYSLPGYYYLHRRIPFYDAGTGRGNNLHRDLRTLRASVSHIVTEDALLDVPGYVVEKEFGHVRILRREPNDAPVRQWRSFAPIMADDFIHRIVRAGNPDAPPPPPNNGIRFVE